MARLAGAPEERLQALCVLYLRPATLTGDPVTGVYTLVFEPPLTAPEQAIFADIQVMAKFGVDMTLAEWQSIKADAAALKAYLGVATPTLVQTAAATKAIVRVLGVIVRS